jgi:hypothetical protein
LEIERSQSQEQKQIDKIMNRAESTVRLRTHKKDFGNGIMGIRWKWLDRIDEKIVKLLLG